MGYAVYEDINAQRQGMERWAGYGMPGIRDMPTCTSVIFRGLDIKWEIICTYSQDGDIEKGDLLIVEGAHWNEIMSFWSLLVKSLAENDTSAS